MGSSNDYVWTKTIQQTIPTHLPCLAPYKGFDASTAVYGAWAIVLGRLASSNVAKYAVSLAEESPEPGTRALTTTTLRIQLSHGQPVSTYLQSLQHHILAAQSCSTENGDLDDAASDTAPAAHFRSLLILQRDKRTVQDCNQLLQQFDLVLYATVSASQIVMSALFGAQTMDDSLADKYLDRLDYVTSQLLQPPNDKPLAEIDIVTTSELQQLWTWNATVPASVNRSVDEIVAETVRKDPAATAVCAWDGSLTYAMLDQLSTVLVAQLVSYGVGPDTLVPLCFHKSKWTSVAVLAVLKAGGAFVLLDPSLPEKRLQAIVEQMAAKVIMSSKSNQQLSRRLVGAESPSAVPVLVVGASVSVSEGNNSVPDPNLEKRAHPQSTCYLVFTSGSTGTPKGILLTHENAASALHHHVPRLGLTSSTRIFDGASYSTDVSISNLFLAWAVGGCLCVPSDAGRSNNPEQSILDLRANTIDLTPSLARLLSPANLIPQVRLVIFGGEALRLGDVERWWARGARVVHEYGSSECTQNSTINNTATSPREALHIGTGAGLVTWVVDPHNHEMLLPPGSTGELLLEGPLVGRGFLHDPERSAAIFLEQDATPAWLLRGGPGCPGRTGRIYKSGDLVRYNADGSLIFVGRKEGQAKVRGQRVDLSEVEHWVRARLPESDEVVAEIIMPRGEHTSSTLVVFLQPTKSLMDLCRCRTAADVARLPAQVEDALAQHLPAYMIPSALVFLEQLPKTASGKMDRARLRLYGAAFTVQQLAAARTSTLSLKQPPTSDAELRLQAVWARVLGLDASSIGRDDSFFHLGGDSLAAMRIVTEIRKVGLCISVADMFHHRRLHQVAARAVPMGKTGTVSEAISRRSCSGPLQQSISQERIWLAEQRSPGSQELLKAFAIRLRGRLQLLALNSALQALTRRHETLRTTFATRGQVHMQEIHPFQPRALSVVDLSGGSDLHDALYKHHTAPFHFDTEPAWRVCIYRCGQDDHVLSLVMHNLIADGWSIALFSRELTSSYSAALRNEDPLVHLDALPIRYADYASWQRHQTTTAGYQRQLDYWLDRLHASRPAEIPRDKPRPATPSHQAQVLKWTLEVALYTRVQRFCDQRQVMLFDVLLSAIVMTTYRLSGVGEAVFGVAYANRPREELRSLIGSIVNLHCLCIAVGTGNDESFSRLVGRVEAVKIAALANQDVPLADVVSKLGREDGPPHRMVYSFNNTGDPTRFELEGVETEGLETGTVTTRDDWEVVVNHDAGDKALEVQIYFATDIYERDTMENMLDVLKGVLAEGVGEAEGLA